MPILAIDSSTGPASAAILGEDGSVIALFEDSEPMRQSQFLVGNLDRLVRENGGYSTLSAIVVTVGPGGFTGIRIAIAAARGLALAANLPVIGVTTLEAFAWSALASAADGAKAFAMVDAYRGQAYCQSFIKSAGIVNLSGEHLAINFEEITIPSGESAIANFVFEGLGGAECLSPPYAALAGAYAAALLRGHSTAELAKARPAEAVYIRPPDAKPQTPFLQNHTQP